MLPCCFINKGDFHIFYEVTLTLIYIHCSWCHFIYLIDLIHMLSSIGPITWNLNSVRFPNMSWMNRKKSLEYKGISGDFFFTWSITLGQGIWKIPTLLVPWRTFVYFSIFVWRLRGDVHRTAFQKFSDTVMSLGLALGALWVD